MTVTIYNNSNNSDIYDVTLAISKKGKVMYVDIQFDRVHNLKLGCDATQFENDLVSMLKFVADEPIEIKYGDGIR